MAHRLRRSRPLVHVAPIAVMFLVIVLAAPAFSIDAVLEMGTSSYNPIPGENTDPGFENTIDILGYAHRSEMPIDATTGQPTGRETCGPFVIRKLVDRTSPLLFDTLIKGTMVTTFKLRLIDASGIEYYQITLEEAYIASISRAGAENDPVPSEQITFVYDKITEEHVVTGFLAFMSCNDTTPVP